MYSYRVASFWRRFLRFEGMNSYLNKRCVLVLNRDDTKLFVFSWKSPAQSICFVADEMADRRSADFPQSSPAD